MSELIGRLSSAITVPGQDLPMTCVPRIKGGATGGHWATLPATARGKWKENDRATTNRKPRSGILTTVNASHSVSVNSYHQYYLTDLHTAVLRYLRQLHDCVVTHCCASILRV